MLIFEERFNKHVRSAYSVNVMIMYSFVLSTISVRNYFYALSICIVVTVIIIIFHCYRMPSSMHSSSAVCASLFSGILFTLQWKLHKKKLSDENRYKIPTSDDTEWRCVKNTETNSKTQIESFLSKWLFENVSFLNLFIFHQSTFDISSVL